MKTKILKYIWTVYQKCSGFIKFIVPKSVLLRFKAIMLNFLAKSPKKKHIDGSLSKGINLIGFIRAEFGLGHGCRLLGYAIESAGIPWGAITVDNAALVKAKNTDETWNRKIIEKQKYSVNVAHINPDVLDIAKLYLPPNIWNVPYNIGVYLWELPEVPESWVKSFDYYDEIWAPSQFIVDALTKKTSKPVIKIPYGIELSGYEGFKREDFGLPPNKYLFLVMYDINSTAARKNPGGAITAFKAAFAPNDNRAGIVIKINNAAQNKKETEELQASLSEYQNAYFITETMPRNKVYGLINSVDCFVSLHRSEGFGLVIAEAMYLGKPVIATNWSSNVDFMDKGNSYLTDYTLVPVGNDYGPYQEGQMWAQPDYNQAAEFMQTLAINPAQGEAVGNEARKFIRENYTIESSGAKLKKRLQEVGVL